MIKLDIISGFLGSGKTTMIKKLMSVVSSWNEKLVLIENEFGKIGIDGDLVKREGIEVYEISQGCICCTLKNDFMYTLIEIADKLKPDRILFEPSGIFVLSDALEILKVPDIAARFRVNSLTTVVDSVNYIKQNSKFGYFFENQITNVSTLVLSKTQLVSADEIDRIITSLKQVNNSANILAKNWDELNDEDFKEILGEALEYHLTIPHICSEHCGHLSEKNDHDEEHSHNHSHHQSETGHGFETMGMKTSRTFSSEELVELLNRVRNGEFGDIIRSKGFLKSSSGYIEFSFTGSDFSIHEYKGVQEGKVSFIGEKLNNEKLTKSFE